MSDNQRAHTLIVLSADIVNGGLFLKAAKEFITAGL